MPNSIVKGIYRNGVAMPLEAMPDLNETSVLIVFLEKEQSTKEKVKKAIDTSDCWVTLKRQIEAKYPEVKRMTDKERVQLFEQLSQKAAENLPFQTLEEAEKFTRRQDYDVEIMTPDEYLQII